MTRPPPRPDDWQDRVRDSDVRLASMNAGPAPELPRTPGKGEKQQSDDTGSARAHVQQLELDIPLTGLAAQVRIDELGFEAEADDPAVDRRAMELSQQRLARVAYAMGSPEHPDQIQLEV